MHAQLSSGAKGFDFDVRVAGGLTLGSNSLTFEWESRNHFLYTQRQKLSTTHFVSKFLEQGYVMYINLINKDNCII